MKDGILIIDKPADYTSHDVVAKVRKVLGTKKVGHTGTLDPMATGVLVVCVGSATKLVEYFTSKDKIYKTKIKLGIKTDTGDITGEIICEKPINSMMPVNTRILNDNGNYNRNANKDEENISNEQIFIKNIEEVCKSFIGKQKQIPPMYSSIKVNGVKLYEYARKGIHIDVGPRDIEIFDIKDISYTNDEIEMTVHCSKGTYIRTLCEDIAEKLGTVGTMSYLRRIQTGNFNIENSIKLEDISEEKIIPMENLFDKKITLSKDVNKLMNGVEIPCELPDGLYNLYTDHYIGIGKIKDKKLKREIIL